MSHIGPNTPAATLARLDGRTREGRLMRRVRSELTAHVGGKPSATQRMLIERATTLSLYVEMLDRKMLETGAQNEHDSRTYLAWSNSLTRTLRELGLQASDLVDPVSRFQQHIAGRAA